MELDITHMMNSKQAMRLLSGSVAYLGPDAAKNTWENCKDYSALNPLLSTPEQLEEARKFFKEMGFSEDVYAMPDYEIQALTTQYIASEILAYDPKESSIFETDGKYYIYIGI